MVVGQDQIDVPAPSQRAVDLQAADGREVVRLEPEAEIVEPLDRAILDVWRIEAIRGAVARLRHPCRLIFVPRLVCRDLLRLRRSRRAAEHLLTLPSLPRELVVVPDTDERPAG